ncbi:MAG: substrate-binding domain-containing protein [Methylococcaceae bacterium]|nr:substrate-binding domain-containing protein [Methylococcaceae bacterium]
MDKKFAMMGAVALGLSLSGSANAEEARDYISAVGSSTVYPFATVVAEQFGKAGKFKTPKIESTGTGGGMKLFCGGVGVQHPDVANASRKIKKSEFDACQKAGVKDIVEVKIGFDGIVLANSKKSKTKFQLSRKEIYQALAKRVPDPAAPESEALVENPYKTWNQINPKLPQTKIEVLGPPPTSGTRDALAELALEGGCQGFAWLKAKKESDKDFFNNVCMTVRQDGGYIEAGENDNLILQKLEANPNAVGIFGYSYLDQNKDKIKAATVDGEEPTYETISSGKYAISRPLFFYVKKAHIGVIPGIVEYVAEFTSEKAWGDEGYLADKGLIPLPSTERKKIAEEVKNLPALSLE